MRKEIEIRRIIREYGRNRKLRRITLLFSAVVACVTAYVLINPANTMTAETYCGYEEHVHDETCYALKPATPSKAGKNTPSEHTPSEATPSDSKTSTETSAWKAVPYTYEVLPSRQMLR